MGLGKQIDLTAMKLSYSICCAVLLAAASLPFRAEACGCGCTALAAECDGASRIRSFYAEYIEACLCKGADSSSRRQTVIERYVAAPLVKRLRGSELDYDPFLQAQDCDRSMLENLTVELCADRDTYRVGLWDGYNGCYRYIMLAVDADGSISDISGKCE